MLELRGFQNGAPRTPYYQFNTVSPSDEQCDRVAGETASSILLDIIDARDSVAVRVRGGGRGLRYFSAASALEYPVHREWKPLSAGATNGVIGSARDIETEFNTGRAVRTVRVDP